MTKGRWRSALVLAVAAAVLLIPAVAVADPPPLFEGPLFGLGTDEGGDVVVADAARGVARANGDLIAELPNVTDVTASDQGWLWAITGGGPGPGDGKLYKVYEDGTVTAFADLAAYEAKNNPDGGAIDSNPYSVADLGGGEAVVADAAGNALLKVSKQGKVKLIAVFPSELVSTANAKSIVEEAVSGLVGEPVTCDSLPPEAPLEAQEVCDLPDMIPAESVPTSVAIGSNGDFYVGELKGFPAPIEESKVWRIRWNARNADCSRSPLCSVAYDGFTSIVDLATDNGSLYVAEFSEKSWFAVELALFEGLPVDPGTGTINECNGACTAVAPGIPFLSAITVDGSGDLWYAGLFGPVIPVP
jgi:hypothetical protein